MDTTELLKKVRKIEIRTRGISKNIFSGEYHSVFKGKGMAFTEVREYQFGDDIRNIDWNVTARFNHPFVKIFDEERELTVILMVDVSGSGNFGTQVQFKREMITEICAVLAFSSLQNNDKVGVIFFSDKIEKFIPPKKGRSHVLRIIRELLEFEPAGTKTDINSALRYLTNIIKKRSIAFVLSDFISPAFEEALKIAGKKHDTIAVQIYDKRETQLEDVGLVYSIDAESGKSKWLDTSSPKVRDDYKNWWQSKQSGLIELFNKNNIDFINISTEQNYVVPLMNFFKRRGSRK